MCRLLLVLGALQAVSGIVERRHTLPILANVLIRKNGKEVTYAATDLGRGYVQRYREIRENCLIDALNADDALNKDIGELACLLRVLSGMYDQAARSAASL